jgi:hypothetical protein
VLSAFDDHRAGGIDTTVPLGSRNASPLATVHRSKELTIVRRQGSR